MKQGMVIWDVLDVVGLGPAGGCPEGSPSMGKDRIGSDSSSSPGERIH